MCTEMLWMCVLYVSFGSKVRPRAFGCVSMGSAVLCILRSRLLVYSAGSGVNRVQVVLSRFSMSFFFVHAKPLCRYGCICVVAALVLVCVDLMDATLLQKYDSPLTVVSVMNIFFIYKIDNIQAEFPFLEAN